MVVGQIDEKDLTKVDLLLVRSATDDSAAPMVIEKDLTKVDLLLVRSATDDSAAPIG
jgi:hypothetical protein